MASTTTTTTTTTQDSVSKDESKEEQETHKVITFEKGKIGIAYTGHTIKKVSAGGQGAKNGVKIGWTIVEINGEDQDDDADSIFTTIDAIQKSTKKLTIKFKKDLSIKPDVVVGIVEEKKNPVYLQGIEGLEEFESVIRPIGTAQVNKYVWERIHKNLEANMHKQIKLSQNFKFDKDVHRFPDIYPYDFNAMPDHIGSWMGDCFGLMQWPMPGVRNNRILQLLVSQNNVTMIIALGQREPNERKQMVEYWKTLGTNFREIDDKHFKVYKVTGIEPDKSQCTVYHYPQWPDMSSPKLEQIESFNYMFGLVKKVEEEGKRIIVHCRAGVGRSGTFRLMYKAWKKEFDCSGIPKAVHDQRALRMWTVQTNSQYSFLQAYVKTLEGGDKKIKDFNLIGGDAFNKKSFKEAAFWFWMYQTFALGNIRSNYKNFDVAIKKFDDGKRFRAFLFEKKKLGELNHKSTWEECCGLWESFIKNEDNE